MKGDNLLAFISGADKEYKSFKDKVKNEACTKEKDVTSDQEKENVEEDERAEK